MNEQDLREKKVKPHIQPNHKSLKTYNGQPIVTYGKCNLTVRFKGKEHKWTFVVVDSLLEDKTCENLGLVKRVYLINDV